MEKIFELAVLPHSSVRMKRVKLEKYWIVFIDGIEKPITWIYFRNCLS